MKKLLRLSDYTDNGKFDSVSDMLEMAMDRATDLNIKKAIVIFWDESEVEIERQVKWHQCGLSRREHLNLLSMAKNDFIIDTCLSHSHEY
jgi:hypothetical protein